MENNTVFTRRSAPPAADIPHAIISSPLFYGIEKKDIKALLSCFSAKTGKYAKNGVIFTSGEKIKKFGVVLSGQVQYIIEDYYGNRSIISGAEESELFGEAFAFSGIALPFSIYAASDCEVLFIDCARLAVPCAAVCSFHGLLIGNMLNILAGRNTALMRKIEICSKRTTRGKLLAYLSGEAKKAGSNRFKISFNRQELADFLSVDRSAMSAELGRLRGEGLLKFNKNSFELLIQHDAP